MNRKHLEILTNIIGGVESGGQIYGNRNYAAYAAAGQNSENEKTCTLGWAQNYGNEARKLCWMIRNRDFDVFREADTADIEYMLRHDWVEHRWDPSAAEKKALIAIITTDVGKACQDELFRQLMEQYTKEAEAYGVTDPQAQMMWCEIQHVGGTGPVKRIFDRAAKPYTPDTIFAALLADQRDTGSDNQVGDRKFQSRHECCVKWIKQYVTDEKGENMTAIEKLISIAAAEVSYLEKNSNSQLDSKTGNAGSNNYTKYARDLYPSLQAQAWCDMFADWCFVQAFGQVPAKQLIGGGFSAYTPTSAQYYKDKGQYHRTDPQPGDQVFFKNATRICHTGIIYKVDAKAVYTIEGNTSAGSSVIANGGAVCKKSYPLTHNGIDGYGRPNWGLVEKPSYDPNKWVHDVNGWWYPFSTTEYYKAGWQDINGHRYYFNADGYAVTGWQQIDGHWYYFEPTAGHPLECALYVSDSNGVQQPGEFL